MTTSDHNLLFGVLAVQLDFVSRDQLIAAMHRWVLDKGRTLADLLVEQGSLSAERRAMLVSLVDEHIKQHEGDPQRSLAAMPAVPEIRGALEAVADVDVAASLVHLPKDTPRLADVTRTAPAQSGEASGVRFRILRPHAEGGLGKVWIARDDELSREVALKEIQPRHAFHTEFRERFIREAEITGGLEHPGVVPVYGLGCYPDGRPYYAMRFIRGESLEESIRAFHDPQRQSRSAAERSLEFRKLLGRLVDVCNAIEYAHSRGVLHRDLKPGNVMLGKYGETLVVDWGLAKQTSETERLITASEPPLASTPDRGATPTQMGTGLGTPAYRSPEQAAGRLDLLGPASDVYSLGATLYTLLTGELPFKGSSVADVDRLVQRGDFRRPREVDPKISRALEAVCLKAMALAPADRYSSALALADDLEHWLADEPVAARRETTRERLTRLARRHKSWTQAAAAVLVIGAAVSVTSALVVNRARQDERTQKEAAQRAEARAEASLAEAERERERAEESFRQARGTVDELLTTVSESTLLNVPGLQPLRKELLESALRYYEGFSQQRADDPSVQAELAATHQRIGSIIDEIGSKADAIQAYERALEIFDKLAAAHPEEQEYQNSLASLYNNIGYLKSQTSQSASAMELYARSIAIRKKLLAESPDDPDLRASLALTYNNCADLERLAGRFADAQASLRRALEIREDLVRLHPDVVLYQDKLAGNCFDLGRLERDQGHFAAAKELCARGLAIRERLVRENPEDLAQQSALANSYNEMGLYYDALSQTDPTIDMNRKALAIREKLAQENPQVVEYQAELAQSYYNLGYLMMQKNEPEEARKSLEQSREVYQDLAEREPDVIAYGYALAHIFNSLAILDQEEGEMDAALANHNRALEMREKLTQAHPEIVDLKSDLAASYHNLGRFHHTSGDLDQAIAQYEKAHKLCAVLIADNPELLDHRRTQTFICVFLGIAHEAKGNVGEALRCLSEARQAIESITREEANPEDLYILAQVLSTMTRLVGQDTQRSTEEIKQAQAECTQAALEALRKSRDGGYPETEGWRTDEHLEPIRSNPEFEKLFTPKQE